MNDDSAGELSIAELQRRYAEERNYLDDRAAAEYAYVLAVRLRQAGDLTAARRYAIECLLLAQRLPTATLDDVAVNRQSLGGVPMPEQFHDGVVRSRLADLLSQ